MKPEWLEPLLLDRALGELSPDVAALLEEHLAHHPYAARRAAEFDETLVAARAITRLDAASSVPAPDSARWQQVAPAARATARRSQWLPLAACLALGAVGGWLAHPTPVPSTVTPAARVEATTSRSPAATSAGLWSRSRIVSEQTRDRPASHSRESPRPARPPTTWNPFRNEKL
ncbi:hypothetical protein [Opitutus terrae]|uniref:Putative transmembrane anti-sigma factor n=1 Tax=Opitutus terrae (strain DSM 11246 / JCM 15787 / PB90-1) TaxID=452637 RepID=B1ZTN8_OPITP|nr:hypothetical protein [Opitutus terrae]ACB74824.1 putative transmembrane anti-sigma factor [Opitutus terrae PB90-1]